MQNISRSRSRPIARSIAVVGGITIISALFAGLLGKVSQEPVTDASADVIPLLGKASQPPIVVTDEKKKSEASTNVKLSATVEATSQAEIDAKREAAREKAAAEEEAAREAAEAAADRSLERAVADPKAAARTLMAEYGWGEDQFSCLDSLWTKESNWQHDARNPSSGAYGIPQSLPAEKMATAGADYLTNPVTQIEWGLGYINDTYGTPCSALGHSQATNWY